MPTHLGTSLASVDTRDGNHFEIFKVTHSNGTITDIPVPDSCVSAAILMNDITAAATPAQETSTSAGITVRNLATSDATASGIGIGNWADNDGVKQVCIASNAASGTYYVVARYVGSGAGVGGGTKMANF